MPETSDHRRLARLFSAAWVFTFAATLLLGIYLVWFHHLGSLTEHPIDWRDLAKWRYEYTFAYENTPFEFAQGLILLFASYFYLLAAVRGAGRRGAYFAFLSAFIFFFFLEDFDWLCGFSLHSRILPTMSLAAVFGIYIGVETVIGLRRLIARKWSYPDILRLSWPLYILLPNLLIMPSNKMSAAQFYISFHALYLALCAAFVETGRIPDVKPVPGENDLSLTERS